MGWGLGFGTEVALAVIKRRYDTMGTSGKVMRAALRQLTA